MGWLGFLLAAVTVAVWQGAHGMGVNQAVNVGRTVADIAENIGRWASKYGGVHVRTLGANAALPGNFLTRSMYAGSPADASTLGGTKTMAEARVSEREAMARLEAYHWKNPALIQREVADVIGESGGRVRYRMTARTVLNPNNAANGLRARGHGGHRRRVRQGLGRSPATTRRLPVSGGWRVLDGAQRAGALRPRGGGPRPVA